MKSGLPFKLVASATAGGFSTVWFARTAIWNEPIFVSAPELLVMTIGTVMLVVPAGYTQSPKTLPSWTPAAGSQSAVRSYGVPPTASASLPLNARGITAVSASANPIVSVPIQYLCLVSNRCLQC